MGIIKLSEVEKREDGKWEEGGLRRELWRGSMIDGHHARWKQWPGDQGCVQGKSQIEVFSIKLRNKQGILWKQINKSLRGVLGSGNRQCLKNI